MAARTKARKRALDLLFEAESRGLNVSTLLSQRVETPVTEHPLPDYMLVGRRLDQEPAVPNTEFDRRRP